MRLAATALFALVLAGNAASLVAPPAAEPEKLARDLPRLLAAVASGTRGSLPDTRFCADVPTQPVSVACAGADWSYEGARCQGLGAPALAVDLAYVDLAYSVSDIRYGAFVYCSDQPELNGPGTDYYNRWVLLASAAETAPGPSVYWWEYGYVAGPGAEPFSACAVDTYLYPAGLVSSQPCLAGSPPYPPVLP